MSTVVLTPTHIASDHTVVYKCFPHETKVDLNHKKLFVDSSKKFIIGTCGDYVPEKIELPEVQDAVAFLLSYLISHQNVDGGELVPFFDGKEDQLHFPLKKSVNTFKNYFDTDARTFLVSKHYRFCITHSAKLNILAGKRIGDYAGVGSGGMIATGLLLGKMPLEEIWEPLHRLDKQTSVEHTTIPLSSLKSFDKKFNNKMERFRKEVV